MKTRHLNFIVSLLLGLLLVGGAFVFGLMVGSPQRANGGPPAISRDSSFGAAEAHFDFSKPSAQGLALVDGIEGPANCWNWQGKGWFVSWCEPRTEREVPPIRRPDNE